MPRATPPLRRAPTGRALALFGCGLALLLLATHFGAAAVFVLAFVCLALPLVAPLHVWSAPRGLRARALPEPPVAAGTAARLRFDLVPPPPAGAVLCLQTAFGPAEAVHARGPWVLHLPGLPRGVHSPGPVEIVAHDPLGLFSVRRALSPAEAASLATLTVHPAPDWVAPAPGHPEPAEAALAMRMGDPAGLRDWRSGDRRRDIDWRATAKRDAPIVREREETARARVRIFDWDDLAGQPGETRLSRLTAGVLLAAQDGIAAGLRLPGQVIAPGSGPAHLHRLLAALAAHPNGARDNLR